MSLEGGGGGEDGGQEEIRDRSNGPLVTFSFFLHFFFCGDSERSRTGSLASGTGRPAGVAASMLTEGIHNNQCGRVGHLVKVEDHIPAGPHGLPIVEPADFRFWCA